MKKNVLNYVVTILGLLLLAAGLYLLKIADDPQGIMTTLPFIFIGLGCGVFGHGMGELLSNRAVRSNPELAKKISIENNDERNIAISNKSKAKAYDMMIFVFGALQISFALMGIDLAATLLLIAAYLFVVGFGIYYRIKLDKEM